MPGLLNKVIVSRALLSSHVGNKFIFRGFRYEYVDLPDEEFPVMVIPGHTKPINELKKERRRKYPVPPPRYISMPTDQDWTNAWPTAKSATWSTLPLPIRMGFIKNSENEGIVPSTYGNAEIMKIPNFLHLTPEHIRKHCAAIKKFCTPWPKELETNLDCEKHFPLTVTTCDYVFDGPSLKDERARVVTLKIKLRSLNLDYHGRDKLIRLAGRAYDKKEDMLVLQSIKCPLKQQNYDYIMYLLTALYKESCKTEPWEAEKTLQDMERYFWDLNKSKENVVELLQKLKSTSLESPDISMKCLENLPENPSDSNITELPEVKNYKSVVENLMNEKCKLQDINEYKEIVKKLFNYI